MNMNGFPSSMFEAWGNLDGVDIEKELGKLYNQPLPPREGASIGELAQNMEHNIKVMKK